MIIQPSLSCRALGIAAALCIPGCFASVEGNGTVNASDGGAAQPPADAANIDDAAPEVQDASELDGGDSGSGCNVDGRYALRVSFDVDWAGTSLAGVIPIIPPGKGQLSFTVLADITRRAQGTRIEARACAANVPDFGSILQEHYAARFPEAMWESSNMPRFELLGSFGCYEPGCSFETDAILAQLGAALSPASAVWPKRAAGGSWPDHDNDARQGITVQMRGPTERNAAGNTYSYPPVSIAPLLPRRVNEVVLGLRIGLQLEGTLDSCDALSGSTTAGSVETRAVDCAAASEPKSCSADELVFLDDNLPVWTVRGGSFRGVRVSSTADCAAARFALP